LVRPSDYVGVLRLVAILQAGQAGVDNVPSSLAEIWFLRRDSSLSPLALLLLTRCLDGLMREVVLGRQLARLSGLG